MTSDPSPLQVFYEDGTPYSLRCFQTDIGHLSLPVVITTDANGFAFIQKKTNGTISVAYEGTGSIHELDIRKILENQYCQSFKIDDKHEWCSPKFGKLVTYGILYNFISAVNNLKYILKYNNKEETNKYKKNALEYKKQFEDKYQKEIPSCFIHEFEEVCKVI